MTLTFSLSGITEAQKIIRKKGKNLFSVPSSYCIIDIETTGLSPDFDSIIEVSAVKYIDGKEVGNFTSLIKPEETYDDGTYIDDFIEKLTGITNEMLSNAPEPLPVFKQFKDFIGKNILIGHNINFDINFLYDNFEYYLSEKLDNDFVDTMRFSRFIHPEEAHHRLKDLAERYKVDYSGAHRSLNDCYITHACYEHLQKEMIQSFGSIESFIDSWKKHKRDLKATDTQASKDSFDITHPIYGKVCVFTGTLEKMARKDAMQLVADIGGINADSVTKKTNYLILANNTYCPLIKDGKSNKQKKAEKLKLEGYDIEVIPENVFYDMFEDNMQSTEKN
ncbi:exonuclease domain-containing protein [Clostridium sp. AF02-29]|uniref:exonuclease domain-containing protein n=1 Tax=Clostridium sp. AF02-29 TaxID=2292993 RepID=UPI000E528212|nr:exonuclease domain-containing protein [Clostridium sp. AF02-29]RHS40210.1 hypothetical protein DWV17_11515 [Clostridium sp. AF02-29]